MDSKQSDFNITVNNNKVTIKNKQTDEVTQVNIYNKNEKRSSIYAPNNVVLDTTSDVISFILALAFFVVLYFVSY